MSMSTGGAARAIFLTPEDGERFTIIGGGVRILADGASTGGRCCIFEAPIPPGEGPPLHKHDREDEFFYVLDGRFKFSVDGREFIGERGSFGLAPRGSLHAFRNIGPTTGLLHVTCTPAGLEVPFREVRVPAAGEAGRAPTRDEVVAAFARHGVTFHGPPLP